MQESYRFGLDPGVGEYPWKKIASHSSILTIQDRGPVWWATVLGTTHSKEGG